MDQQGAPDIVWLQAMEYMANIHNNTADESLGWLTPIQKRKGHTPDILAFLHFTFYEKVYYMDSDSTYVLSWSVVHSATERLKTNLCVCFNHNLDPVIRLNDENQNVIIPLEISLTPTKVKNKHNCWHNIKPKAKGNAPVVLHNQQSGSIPNVNPEETAAGQTGEKVKTMTPAAKSRCPCHTRKHKDATPEGPLLTMTAIINTAPVIAPKHGSWVSDVVIVKVIPKHATIPVAKAINDDDDVILFVNKTPVKWISK
jgi:hypothetical protein